MIVVHGIGYSGSGAVVDFLKDNELVLNHRVQLNSPQRHGIDIVKIYNSISFYEFKMELFTQTMNVIKLREKASQHSFLRMHRSLPF